LLNSVVFCDVMQRRLVSHRRFGTTYQSHLRESRCLGLSPETSVQNQPKLHNIPEDDRIQISRSGSLRCRSFIAVFRRVRKCFLSFARRIHLTTFHSHLFEVCVILQSASICFTLFSFLQDFSPTACIYSSSLACLLRVLLIPLYLT
jgi:hypothetical protein